MSTLHSTSHSAGFTPARKTLAPFRLRRHADYGRTYTASRKHFSASMTYFFRLRSAGEEPAQGPRIGLTVGRVMGKAVDRNRIKRRMREAVRLHLDLLNPGGRVNSPAPAIDLILHPRKTVATMDFTALECEIGKVFTQVASLAKTGPRAATAEGASGSRSARGRASVQRPAPVRPAEDRKPGRQGVRVIKADTHALKPQDEEVRP